MKGLLKYLLHRPLSQRLPLLPRMYSSEFYIAEADRDTQTLMSLTHVRCPQGVEVLKRRYRTESARALIEHLPTRRRKRHIGRRALSLVQRTFGFTSYDPMKHIARQQRKLPYRRQ